MKSLVGVSVVVVIIFTFITRLECQQLNNETFEENDEIFLQPTPFDPPMMESRLSNTYYKRYKTKGNAKTTKKNNVPYHQKLKLEVTYSNSKSSIVYKFWQKVSSRRSVVSCTTFKFDCRRGYMQITSGSLTKLYCDDNKPFHFVAPSQYMTIKFYTFPAATPKRFVKCYISGVTVRESKTLSTKDTGSKYCSKSTPAPETYAILLQCVCGNPPIGRNLVFPNEKQGRVVNAAEAIPHKYPWVVLIHFASVTAEEFHCAGAIMSDCMVITAATCVRGYTVADIIVSVGNHELNDTSTGTSYGIDEIIDLGYDAFTHNHNIAILKLSTSLDFVSDDTIRPLCLPSPCDDFASMPGKIAGWGHIDQLGTILPNVLHVADLTIPSQAICDAAYPGVLNPEQLCAYDSSVDSSIPCVTDLGAPLWVEMPNGHHVLAGIQSYVQNCYGTMPGVFTRITEYLSDIRQAMNGCGTCWSFY